MKTHDSIFAVRPFLYAAMRITYNFQDMVFSRGDYSRQIRKICVLELLSQKRVQSFRTIREEEVHHLVETIKSKSGLAINLKNLLYSLSLSILSRTAFGARFKQQDAFKKLLPGIVELFGGISVVDVYPSIKFLHLINVVRPKQRRLHREADGILESVIQEHKAAMKQENEVDDFVQVLLDIQDRGDFEIPLSTSGIKAILMKSSSDAKGTSRGEASLWGGEDVNKSAIFKLKYLNLVIKETLWLHPPAPLLLPRECQESCEVMGYFELIPFGARKRMCPGMSYGIANVELILANLLYHFDWKLPNGMEPRDLDMAEIFGASLRRKHDLCLVPLPCQFGT
ncbi:putative Retrotransposon protein, unclassified, expressed [Hibiscus syriacus]|uniref:Retrotransposon protein, unclassified, expressed n=1 Tax=Hibiscus syriacus TaxID=106335 RepID=A0A6A3AIN2_HIBSY|nr:putative Retrotransposon protein, unclassified, expressed [Hibiscus syriacus]